MNKSTSLAMVIISSIYLGIRLDQSWDSPVSMFQTLVLYAVGGTLGFWLGKD